MASLGFLNNFLLRFDDALSLLILRAKLTQEGGKVNPNKKGNYG
jgi:hypothetical protein